MTDNVLVVRDLKVWFDSRRGPLRVVDGVNFTLQRGETLALLGESGCGKSMTALALMQLLPLQARGNIAGTAHLGEQDVLALPEVAMRKIRGRRMAMIFQEPMTALNPVLTIGHQIGEVLQHHHNLSATARRERVLALLEAVGIPAPQQRIDEYPHQLSGGMKQRVVIAIALAGEPDVLIADEPTTALDVTIQAQILELLQRLQRDTGMALLLITHDLGVVARMAQRVAVMYAGHIVEEATRAEFFTQPRHPYSQKLFASLPEKNKRGARLAVIAGTVPPLGTRFSGCRFVERCEYAWETCRTTPPALTTLDDGHQVRCHLYTPESQPHSATANTAPAVSHPVEESAQPSPAVSTETALLRVTDLKVHFPIRKGVWQRVAGYVYAVDGVSLTIPAGRTLALVGESGCGKTTVGKAILQLTRPTAGTVHYEGVDLTQLSSSALRPYRRALQFIFQDPYSAMNPRMLVSDIVAEGMVAQGIGGDAAARHARVNELLQQVGLSAEVAQRYPHEFSGGQRQRVCIARALAVEPKMIVCDEPTSALDVSVQAQIVNLLKELQDRLGLSYLFITHNMAVVEYLAHEVAVMYLGRLVEHGPVEAIFSAPRHPYTQALLSAVPTLDATTQRTIIRLPGDPPSPLQPPSGCHFHPRCPQALPECRTHYPAEKVLADGRRVSCHLV